jgi:ATP synthase protein I
VGRRPGQKERGGLHEGRHQEGSLVIATFIGLALGLWLDRVFDTSPWLTIIFLILGIIAGFHNLYRFVTKRAKEL